MTTTPTSGAADLPKALRLADAISNLLCSNEVAARTIAAAADELVRLHALAAGQATAAQQPAPSPAPAGWKLVPVEPTEEMLKAADDGDDAYTLRCFGPDVQRVMQGPYDHYCAMLDAAPAAPAMATREPSQTAGMNIAQRILHVGGRNNDAGYVEFGSIQAVEALVRQVLRDLPALAQADSVLEDAERYRLLRRGQHWSVIDGTGNDLRAEALDAAVDAARKQGANHD